MFFVFFFYTFSPTHPHNYTYFHIYTHTLIIHSFIDLYTIIPYFIFTPTYSSTFTLLTSIYIHSTQSHIFIHSSPLHSLHTSIYHFIHKSINFFFFFMHSPIYYPLFHIHPHIFSFYFHIHPHIFIHSSLLTHYTHLFIISFIKLLISFSFSCIVPLIHVFR